MFGIARNQLLGDSSSRQILCGPRISVPDGDQQTDTIMDYSALTGREAG